MSTVNSIILEKTLLDDGLSLYDLSMEYPLMVVFLRHFGCIFCREALKDLSNMKAQLQDKSVKLVFVHMGNQEQAIEYFKDYDFGDFFTISDPECKVYADFGLTKGSFGQLYGLTVMIRGIQAKRDGNAYQLTQIGDGFQMPGIFLIHEGVNEDAFIHNKVSDRPDYEDLISCWAG